uniref:C2 NT-type domain-containing protein n=1 Tax=Mesocestoides corti TaxID=53468 RepID=A0A5K3F1I4_MESCO
MSRARRIIETKTTLPPGIKGHPIAYLELQITLFRWTGRHSLKGARTGGTAAAGTSGVTVRVVWWGEDDDQGVHFRPRIAHRAGHKQTATSTCARYPICVPLHKMQIYLEDMKSLFLDVIDDSSGLTIGRGRLENLSSLTPQNPINRVVAVANAKGMKFGELTVGLSIELTQAPHPLFPKVQGSAPRTFHRSPAPAKRAPMASAGAAPLRSVLKPSSFNSACTLPLSNFDPPCAVNRLPAATVDIEVESINEEPSAVKHLEGTLPCQEPTVEKEAKNGSTDDEGGLNAEVLARIQAALDESRRLRDQVIGSELDDAAAPMVAIATNPHEHSPIALNNQFCQGRSADEQPTDGVSEGMLESAKRDWFVAPVSQTARSLPVQTEEAATLAAAVPASHNAVFDFGPALAEYSEEEEEDAAAANCDEVYAIDDSTDTDLEADALVEKLLLPHT